jgi:hypothetical protein
MSANTIKEIKSWVTPAMIAIIGFLAKNKLEEIEAAVKLIPGVQQQISANVANIENTQRGINELRREFLRHVDLAAKNEEEITLDKLKKAYK